MYKNELPPDSRGGLLAEGALLATTVVTFESRV
jgi:hypothetical protein